MNNSDCSTQSDAVRNTENAPASGAAPAYAEPNRQAVDTYLSFLCRGLDDRIVTLCFMDAATDKPVRGYSCVHCKVCEVVGAWEEVARISPGCTVHITLCETDMKGRRTENMQSVRVICVDIDKESGTAGGTSGGSLELGDLGTNAALAAPDLVVESSPGKYHLYWRVSESIPVERWRRYQVGFAHKFGGDKSLSNAVSLIRVPGFERICKNGARWMPRIVNVKSEELLQPDRDTRSGTMCLAEPQLIRVFPWLQAAMNEGEAALKEERRVAAEWARKLWKERHTVSGRNIDDCSGIDLSGAPELGRNVTLYMTLRELVRERVVERDDVDFDTALALARTLNVRFSCPLSEMELRKTAHSAWLRGVGSGEAWLEKTDYLKEVTTEEKPVIAPMVVPEGTGPVVLRTPYEIADVPQPAASPSGNGHKTAPADGSSDSAAKQPGADVIKKFLELKVKHEDGPRLEDIPVSFEAVGDQIAHLCWQDSASKRDTAKALAAAMSTRNYNLYATWLCQRFLQIGVFRKNGVGVFVRGRSRWGSEVFYCQHMCKEEFVSLMGRVVTKLASRCVRHKVCKQWVKRMPGQTTVKSIGEACWGLAILSEKQERQSPDVIVFQNGVLDLASGVFVLDERAPVKYSHAVWCRFDLEVAKAWLESERARHEREGRRVWTSIPGTGLLTFLDYMGQWFPGDAEIVEVVMRWFGYGMTTDTGRNKFAFFYGPTRAGKGSICRTFCGIVGDMNYSVSDYEALSGGFKAANFMDKLLICIEEVEGTVQEHKNRMGYLKKLLGGEKICIERKYEQPYEDRLVGKFVLQSNEAPVYQDKGHALRARMLAVGFEKSFEEEGASRDPADLILATPEQADAIGTVAALSWWASRNDRRRAFEPEGCRALAVGKEELVDSLDVFELIGIRYCKADAEEGLESALGLELVDLVVEAKGVKSAFQFGKKESMLKTALEKLYPHARHTTNLTSENGKRVRGYLGVSLNRENLILDFEELLNTSPGRFDRLKQALKLNPLKEQVFDL